MSPKPGSDTPDAGYRVPGRRARAELREKGSRFLAFVEPVGDEKRVRARLDELAERYADASHHCWAYRLSMPVRERANDAGEPRGTAGMPILQVLRGEQLSDVLAVVVRWFGGTKLGKGGLARAYSGAVKLALEDLVVRRRIPTEMLFFEVGYDLVGAIQRLVHPPEVELAQSEYGERVEVALRVQRPSLGSLLAGLAEMGVEVRRAPDGGVPTPDDTGGLEST